MPYYPPNGGSASSDPRSAIMPVTFPFGSGIAGGQAINAVGSISSNVGGGGSATETEDLTRSRPAFAWTSQVGLNNGHRYRGGNYSYRRFNWKPNHWCAITTPTNMTQLRLYTGYYADEPRLDTHTKGLGFRFNTEVGDTTFKFVARTASTPTQTVVDTGVTPAVDSYYELFFVWTGAAEVTWFIRDETSIIAQGTVTTNLPTTNDPCGEIVLAGVVNQPIRTWYFHGQSMSLGLVTVS